MEGKLGTAMTLRSVPSLVLVIFAGCTKHAPDPSPLVVIPGQGIPKVAALGMTLEEIQGAVSDLKVRTYPEPGLPWQKDSFGYRTRLPWEKPRQFIAESRSVGLYASEYTKDKPVRVLTFFPNPTPFMIDSNTCFTGQLSCGISFANRRRVTRAEVVAAFGEPSVRRVDLGEGDYRLMEKGTSVSVTSFTDNGVENLFYPAEGISFCLQHGSVISLDVREKVKTPDGRK